MAPDGVRPADRFVQANGLRFHYLHWGAAGASALVLLHGFGNEAHIWDLFAPTVSDRYEIFAFDSRGHGDTDHAEEYGTDQNVSDLTALTAALGLTELALVGFSMGGMTSMIFASNFPERLRRMVLVDVGPEVNPEGAQRLRAAVSQAKSEFSNAEEALAYIRLANPRRSEELVQASLRHAFRARPDGSYELKYDARLRQELGRRTARPSEELWARLERISCPALLVRGGESKQLMEETAKRMLRVMPDARLETVSGAGHSVMMDNPSSFNAVVSSFLCSE